MITAGIAATRPIAVASSASAMPGATTARLVVCDSEMPMKAFMMPHTVPNRPTNGDVAPIVARMPGPRGGEHELRHGIAALAAGLHGFRQGHAAFKQLEAPPRASVRGCKLDGLG